MGIVDSTDFKQQIFMLGRIVEALSERSHVDMFAPVQEANVSFSSLVKRSAESVTSAAGEQVRAMLRVRRLGDQIFGSDLFADPAWDMLLDLAAAQLECTQVSVSSLCIAASVPPTTALRWIRHLTERGLLQRQADPEDGRRVFIALSNAGMEAMMRWLHEGRGHFAAAAGAREVPRAMTMLST